MQKRAEKCAFQPEKRARAHEQRRRRAGAISIGRRAGASCEPRGEVDARGVRQRGGLRRTGRMGGRRRGLFRGEDGSEDEVRVSNAQRGRVRLHWASQSSTGLEVDDERRKNTDTPRPVTTNTPTRHSPKLQIRPLTGPNCNANISTEARRWRWWSRRWRRGLR